MTRSFISGHRIRTATALAALTAGAGMFASSIAIADQTLTLPDTVSDMDLEYEGQLAGLHVWSGDQDFVWLQAPDGSSVIAGYLFNARGDDIASRIRGTTEVDIEVLANAPAGDDRVGTDVSEQTPEDPTGVSPDDIVADEVLADGAPSSVVPEDGLGDGLDGAGASSASGVDFGNGEVSLTMPEGVDEEARHVFVNAEEALDYLPEDVRVEALIALVQTVEDTRTPEEFSEGILEWRDMVDQLLETHAGVIVDRDGESEEWIAANDDVSSSDDVSMDPDDAGNAGQSGMSSLETRDNPFAQDESSSEEVRLDETILTESDGERDSFLTASHEDTLWFGLGRAGAPTVYAWIDPTCPFCAEAMAELAPEVEGGELDLRIILAPLISQDAPDVIAAILTAENPPVAYWNHELDVAAGQPGIDPVPFSELPDEYQDAMRQHHDLVQDWGVPGVPFFVYETAAGEQHFSGVPEAGQFEDAMPQDTLN